VLSRKIDRRVAASRSPALIFVWHKVSLDDEIVLKSHPVPGNLQALIFVLALNDIRLNPKISQISLIISKRDLT
jgi:hypothetical protein